MRFLSPVEFIEGWSGFDVAYISSMATLVFLHLEHGRADCFDLSLPAAVLLVYLLNSLRSSIP